MRILYLAFVELDTPNACRTHVVEVIRNLAALGHRVIVILPRPLAPVAFPPGVTVSYVYPWRFTGLGRLVFHLLAAGWMVYHLLRARPEAVYEREMGGNPWPALLCRIFRVPLFVEINGILLDILSREGAGRWHRVLDRRLQPFELHAAAGLVFPSDHLYARLMREYALSPERCAFILNGFSADRFTPGERAAARARLGLPTDALALVFVGLLWSAYDLPAYLRLVARLRDELPQLVLWIVGDGPMRAAWETQAGEWGLGARVRFAGYQSEEVVANWIRAGNLCLVPHTAEGLAEHGALSTKIWAYAACARAMLLHFDPDQPFPAELLPLFRRVPPGDDRALEAAVRAALADPGALDQEGAANAAWVHQNATWAHTAERIVHFMSGAVRI